MESDDSDDPGGPGDDPGDPGDDDGGPSFGFGDVESPVDPDLLNRVNAGRATPIRWRITEDGTGVDDIELYATVSTIPCDGAGVNVVNEDDIEFTTVGTGFQHLGDGRWNVTWKTAKSWSGTCKNLHIGVMGQEPSLPLRLDFRR